MGEIKTMKKINIFQIMIIEFNKFTGIETRYTLERQFTYDQAQEYIENRLKKLYTNDLVDTYQFEII